VCFQAHAPIDLRALGQALSKHASPERLANTDRDLTSTAALPVETLFLKVN
jgi:hypothetical protein